MSEDGSLPRVVRVPIAGYIDVEIDPSIEVRTSGAWGERTDFETAAVEAASEALGDFFDRARQAEVGLPTEFDWMIDAYPRIAAGNLLLVECNEVEDLGCG